MKHLGDITKIDGKTAQMVHCIIGGSPCQDLSVAGKQKGLSGERSGLFHEQIRIQKEMLQNVSADTCRGCGRFLVWENVPGAFSSNHGEDFRTVLEEIARIRDETAVIPRPPKGKWQTAGIIDGDNYQIAWRVRNAVFWGTPQRRRRIALVADFGGHRAAEILFCEVHPVRKGLHGNPEQGKETRERTAGETADCTGETVISFQERAGKSGGAKGS